MNSHKEVSFISKIKEEVLPILRHAVVFSVLIVIFAVFAIIFNYLLNRLPEQSENIKSIEHIDLILIKVLVVLFGVRAIAEVLIRSISSMVELARKSFSRKGVSESLPKQVDKVAVLSEPALESLPLITK